MKKIIVSDRKNLEDYWKNPDDGLNEAWMYLGPRGWLRSVHLYQIINDLIYPEDNPSILEIGTNIGRNLMMCRFGNYTNLHGIELSEIAVTKMREIFPMSESFDIKIGSVQDLIYTYAPNSFDIVYTMAVLEHIPLESEHVFKQMVNTTKQYIITIEDERTKSWRHFPRTYERVFVPLGMKQIKVIKRINGLSKDFVGRIFKKKEK